MSMAGCFFFVDTVDISAFKDGDVKWTDDYKISFLTGHKCRGGVKYDDKCWKITLILSSDREEKLDWPVEINCKVSVLGGAKRPQVDTFSKRWCKEDVVNFSNCSWDDCVTMQHSHLLKEGLSDTEKEKVTFMWFLEPSVHSLSSTNRMIGANETGISENKERTQHSGATEGGTIHENPEWPHDRRHTATLTYTVNTNKLKAGDILWTQSYKCDYPVLHRIQGGIKMETDRWLFTLIPSSDQQNQHLKWPVRLKVKLYTAQGTSRHHRGSLDKTWQRDELSSAYSDSVWENSIEVSLGDLQVIGPTDASDGSVTIRWDADVMLPQCESQLQQAKESKDQLEELAKKFEGMLENKMRKLKSEMGGERTGSIIHLNQEMAKVKREMDKLKEEMENMKKEMDKMKAEMDASTSGLTDKLEAEMKSDPSDYPDIQSLTPRRPTAKRQRKLDELLRKGKESTSGFSGKRIVATIPVHPMQFLGGDKFFYSSDSDSETESSSVFSVEPKVTSIPVHSKQSLESTSGSIGLSRASREEQRDQPRK